MVLINLHCCDNRILSHSFLRFWPGNHQLNLATLFRFWSIKIRHLCSTIVFRNCKSELKLHTAMFWTVSTWFQKFSLAQHSHMCILLQIFLIRNTQVIIIHSNRIIWTLKIQYEDYQLVCYRYDSSPRGEELVIKI